MTDEQLIIIEARAGVLKTTMPYPSMWNLDSAAIDFIRNDVPALVAEVRRLRQFEAMAIDNFGELESASMAAHSEALTLFRSMKAQLHPESEAAPAQTTVGIILQISNIVAGLRDERDQLRANVERIGRERDQMVAANVDLQERLSRLEDDLK